MKILKWNFGVKGLVVGSLSLLASTVVGIVAEDILHKSIKRSDDKKDILNEENAEEKTKEEENDFTETD